MADLYHQCLHLDKHGNICGAAVWSSRHGQVGEACWNHSQQRKDRIIGLEWSQIVTILFKNIKATDKDEKLDLTTKARTIAMLVSQFVVVDRHLLDRKKVEEFEGKLLQFESKLNNRQAS